MDTVEEQLEDDGLISVRANVNLSGQVYAGMFYRVDPESQYVQDCLLRGRLTREEDC